MNSQRHRSNNYKIILRHAHGWQDFDSARVQVSVPTNPDYDPRTRGVIDWAVENFDNVTLCLHDSIQRHNHMAAGLSEHVAYQTAIRNGDEWLKNNVFPSDAFVNVVRWDQLLRHPDYKQTHQRILDLYRQNKGGFGAAIDHDLEVFADRCQKRGEEYGPERAAFSRSFLLEEVAGYVPLFQTTSAADLHAGMRMKAMQLLLGGVGDFKFEKNLVVTVKTFGTERPLERQNKPQTACRIA